MQFDIVTANVLLNGLRNQKNENWFKISFYLICHV